MTQLQVHGLTSYVDSLGLFYKVVRCIILTCDTCIRWSNGRQTNWDSYLAVSFSHTDVVKALQGTYRTDSTAAYQTISKLPLPLYQSRSDLALQGHLWEELDLAVQKHLWTEHCYCLTYQGYSPADKPRDFTHEWIDEDASRSGFRSLNMKHPNISNTYWIIQMPPCGSQGFEIFSGLYLH